MSGKGLFERAIAVTLVLCSGLLSAQTKPSTYNASTVQEFPVTMRQKVAAGMTPVGTKVEARLEMATLVNGTVIPAGATFSGEVIESVARSAKGSSRLSLRMDSVRWKNGSASIKVYLTPWYYPIRTSTEDASSDELSRPRIRTNRMGTVPPPPTSPDQEPFPGSSAPSSPQASATPALRISENRVVMKNVESTRGSDGSVALSSSRLNIKLDKTTTYVLATGELTSAK